MSSRDLSQHLREFRFHVDDEEIGLRLDHALQGRIHWRSRTDLQLRVREKRILLNGKPTKASVRLQAGDEVIVLVSKDDLPDQDPAKVELEVLHEDRRLIVLAKQPGQVVHPTGRHVYDTLINALFLRYRRNGEDRQGVVPQVAHRLDRQTSGVLVIAKDLEAKRFLQDEFEARRPDKRYCGIVAGGPEADHGVIDQPILRDATGTIRIRMKIDPAGAASCTDYQVVERFPDAALLRFRLHTGRQHQIRVHAQYLGHTLLCDPLYGDPREVGFDDGRGPTLTRQALHAEHLTIRHPDDGKERTFTAPLPRDLTRTLEGLRDGRRLTWFEDRQSEHWRV
ncbi:MAG: RluA family pseudouridine synthase [Planctomycetes bacterium]|nr:RluA family pseudouridine synthase [Planctomycetota bacterium]